MVVGGFPQHSEIRQWRGAVCPLDERDTIDIAAVSKDHCFVTTATKTEIMDTVLGVTYDGGGKEFNEWDG